MVLFVLDQAEVVLRKRSPRGIVADLRERMIGGRIVAQLELRRTQIVEKRWIAPAGIVRAGEEVSGIGVPTLLECFDARTIVVRGGGPRRRTHANQDGEREAEKRCVWHRSYHRCVPRACRYLNMFVNTSATIWVAIWTSTRSVPQRFHS